MKGGGRIKEILKETILALLNNGVEFSSELQIDGLLGVTVDSNDVFLVKISETVPSLKRSGHVGGNGDSSDEETGIKAPSSTMPQSKAQRRKRPPSPKQTGFGKNSDKRQRVSSPTQAVPSSSTKDTIKTEDFGKQAAVDIDLTSVKMEPVDTTVADSNQSADSNQFDYSQNSQAPAVIPSIQSIHEADNWQGNPEIGGQSLSHQVRISSYLSC